MEDDLEPGPVTRPKRLRLNAREQTLAAIPLGLVIVGCLLLLVGWFL